MDRFMSQSTPSNYYTPKPRSAQLQKSLLKSSVSTVAQAQNLEESLKVYEQLLIENVHLKSMLFEQNNHSNQQNAPYSNNQCQNKSQYFNHPSEAKLARHQSSKCLNSTNCIQSSHQGWSQPSQTHYQSYKDNDMAMWSIRQRNKYLQQKLDNLQGLYRKQNNAITNITSSQKWQNRFDCKETTCYQDKYIKLLRVKSPVLLD